MALTISDVNRFYSEYCWRPSRLLPMLSSIVVAALVALAVINAIMFSKALFDIKIPWFVEVPLIFVLVFSILRLLQPLVWRMFPGDLNVLTELTEYELLDDGLATRSASADCFIRWQAFKDVLVTRRAAYLGIGASRAVILPRRAFKSTAEFDQFISILRVRTGLK